MLQLLHRGGVKVNAALWQKDELLDNRWSFTIVTPLVDELGVKGTYKRIDELMGKGEDRPRVDLWDISVMTPKAYFYKSLKRELRNVRERAITRGPVGDHTVNAGYIYFIK